MNKTNYKKLWELEQSRSKKIKAEYELVSKHYKNLFQEYENMKVMLDKMYEINHLLYEQIKDEKILKKLSQEWRQLYPSWRDGDTHFDFHPEKILGVLSRKHPDDKAHPENVTYKDIDEVEGLTPKQKKTYKEWLYQGENYTNTAKILKTTPQNVRQIVKRAEPVIRKKFKKV